MEKEKRERNKFGDTRLELCLDRGKTGSMPKRSSCEDEAPIHFRRVKPEKCPDCASCQLLFDPFEMTGEWRAPTGETETDGAWGKIWRSATSCWVYSMHFIKNNWINRLEVRILFQNSVLNVFRRE